MELDGSITQLMTQLKAGDQEAAQKIWERYYADVADYCRRRIPHRVRAISDEDDCALSAFADLFDGAAAGRFPRFSDRSDLWRLLLTIAQRKVGQQLEWFGRQKRGEGRGPLRLQPGSDSVGDSGLLANIPDKGCSPQSIVLMADVCDELMRRLPDDRSRTIACMKLKAYTNREIAERLGCSLRRIERILHEVRERWQDKAPTQHDEVLRLIEKRLDGITVSFTVESTESRLRETLLDDARNCLLNTAPTKRKTRREIACRAASVMRRVLTDHARALQKKRRGDGQTVSPIDKDSTSERTPADPQELLALDDTVERLESQYPQLATVFNLHYFMGYPLEEIATEILDISVSNAKQYWMESKRFIHQSLTNGKPSRELPGGFSDQ